MPSNSEPQKIRRSRPVPSGRAFVFALVMLAVAGPASVDANQEVRHRDLTEGCFKRTDLDFTEMLRRGVALKLHSVNSDDREEKPLISADGKVMFFTSDRMGERPWARFNRLQNRYDADIWVSTRIGKGATDEMWSIPSNIGAPINSSGDEEMAAIASDGQSAYFTSLRPGWDKDGGPFYFARLKGTVWTELRGLGGGMGEFFRARDRSERFKVYGASISADGKSFYFATTLHSPDKNHQIWVSHLRDGVWSYPENLGPVVNGPGGSCAPFIAADGKTLFFAADREGGLGGDDIYITVRIGGQWQEPENIGTPINTPNDDAFLSVPASGERVYLSSSRDGDDDLYVAPLPDIVRPGQVVLLGGKVFDKNSGMPIEANIVIEDLASGVTVYNANSNAQSGRYTLVLEPGRDYSVSISAPGYAFSSRRYTLSSNASYDEMRLDFSLEELRSGTEITLNNIFYDYNSADLRPESRLELDRLVKLMQLQPEMKITVCGHTDSVGSATYNAQLSLKRAESVKQYVASKGAVDVSRINVKGFGSQQPAAPNSTEEGRQKNRRITFVVE